MKVLLATILYFGAANAALASQTDAEFSQSFKCPESLSSDKERSDALEQFVNWAAATHPDWTIEKLVSFRMQLLTEHHCDKTLAHIHQSSKSGS
jgi:hypothetical protein